MALTLRDRALALLGRMDGDQAWEERRAGALALVEALGVVEPAELARWAAPLPAIREVPAWPSLIAWARSKVAEGHSGPRVLVGLGLLPAGTVDAWEEEDRVGWSAYVRPEPQEVDLQRVLLGPHAAGGFGVVRVELFPACLVVFHELEVEGTMRDLERHKGGWPWPLLTYDVGTDYRQGGGGGGIGVSEGRASETGSATFWPAPPPEARELRIRDGERTMVLPL